MKREPPLENGLAAPVQRRLSWDVRGAGAPHLTPALGFDFLKVQEVHSQHSTIGV